jgi:hypothetical protein
VVVSGRHGYSDFRGQYAKRRNSMRRSLEDKRLKQRGLELVLAA